MTAPGPTTGPGAAGRAGAGSGITVFRGTRASRIAGLAAVPLLGILFALPYLVPPGVTRPMVGLFALIVLATMWNLLAGYGGMISVGQQGFIGIGAYTVLVTDLLGVSPYVGIPLAAAAAALVALPTTLVVFRLVGGYFAIGTWVVAEVFRLLTVEVGAVGAGAGASLTGLSGLSPTLRGAVTYWCALGAAALAVGVVVLILRSRLGLALTAVRDDPVAARSSGVQVERARRTVFVVAAAGCAVAGALIVLDSLRVQPDAVFNVQWSAFMIFMVVIGGLGTVEGPILGALVFFALQQLLEPFGVWYLVVLALVAIVMAVFARRGVWGLVTGGRDVRLLPTGYRTRR